MTPPIRRSDSLVPAAPPLAPKQAEAAAKAAIEIDLAPVLQRNERKAVEVPPVRSTKAATARMGAIEGAAVGMMNVIRAWPVDAAFVAKAFAKNDKKAIAQVFETWAMEQKAVGAEGASMLTPIASLCHAKRDVKALKTLLPVLVGPIMEAVVELSRQKADPRVIALVTRLGGIVQDASPTVDPQVTHQRRATLTAWTEDMRALKLPKDEYSALVQLQKSAHAAVSLMAVHTAPIPVEPFAERPGACEDVAKSLLAPERLPLLLDKDASERLKGPALEAIGRALSSIETDLESVVAEICSLSKVVAPFALAACVEAFGAQSGEMRNNVFRTARLAGFLESTPEDQIAFMRAYRALPAIAPGDLPILLPALLSHCRAHMKQPEHMRAAHRAMPLPHTFDPDYGPKPRVAYQMMLGHDAVQIITFADGTKTEIDEQPATPVRSLSHQRAIDVLASIPRDLRRFADKLALTSDEYRTEDGDALMAADADGITSYRAMAKGDEPYVRSTLIHEIGHVAAFRKWGDLDDSRWDAWRAAMKSDGGYASKYAKKNEAEDLSETLVVYEWVRGTPLEQPLRSVFGRRFDLLAQLVEER